MNFISIREYFFKIANRCLLMVLLPLIVFIYIYYQFLAGKLQPVVEDEEQVLWLKVGLPVLGIFQILMFHWLSIVRLRKFRMQPGLGNKLDRFLEITTLRMRSVAISSLLMAVGVVLTGSEWFAAAFLITLAWVPLQWPTSKKACDDLKLRGDEREMVFYKKDKF